MRGESAEEVDALLGTSPLRAGNGLQGLGKRQGRRGKTIRFERQEKWRKKGEKGEKDKKDDDCLLSLFGSRLTSMTTSEQSPEVEAIRDSSRGNSK